MKRIIIPKLFFFIFFLGIPFLSSNAQEFQRESVLDSLEQLLLVTSLPEDHIKVLGELSDYWIYIDSAKAMQYALQIKDLSERIDFQKGLGIAYYYIGGIYMEYYHLDKAEHEFIQAEQFLAKDTSYYAQQILAKTWHNHGALYQRRGDEDTFLNMLLYHAIPIQEKINDTLGIARNYHSIGLIFMNMKDYPRAIDYYEKAIGTFKYYPRMVEMSDVYLRIAYCLIYQKEFTPEVSKKVQYCLKQAEEVLQHHPLVYAWVNYYNIKGLFEEGFKQDTAAALEFYQTGYELADKINEKKLASDLMLRSFYIYFEQEDYELAKECIYTLNNKYEGYFTPADKLNILNNMINTEEKLGNINEAFRLLRRHSALKDSINSKEIQLKVYDLEQKYESGLKELKILDLTNTNAQQSLVLKQRQLWLLIMAATLIILIAVVIIGYLILKNRKMVAENEKKLLDEQLIRLKQDQELKVMEGIMEGQHQERNRLASELHDGLGGALSGIKMKLSGISVNNHQLNGEMLSVITLLDDSIQELRSIARNLMPEKLLKSGLTNALVAYCKPLENKKLKILCQVFGNENQVPEKYKLMIFRIIQELINNAVKHAHADQIIVQCNFFENAVSITVEDNGKGFDPQVVNNNGVGLSSVHARVKYMKGNIEIDSQPGKGTAFEINLEL